MLACWEGAAGAMHLLPGSCQNSALQLVTVIVLRCANMPCPAMRGKIWYLYLGRLPDCFVGLEQQAYQAWFCPWS